MWRTERPGWTLSTFAPMCLENVTSSLKYCARCSSCSSLRVTSSSLIETSLLICVVVCWLDLGYQGARHVSKTRSKAASSAILTTASKRVPNPGPRRPEKLHDQDRLRGFVTSNLRAPAIRPWLRLTPQPGPSERKRRCAQAAATCPGRRL